MSKILGFIDLHNSYKIDGLNDHRSLASTSFLGRYNIIDFALSNFANSDIDKIGILCKEHLRSLIRHVYFPEIWSQNTKTGLLTIMYNEFTPTENYNHDVNNLIENNWVYSNYDFDYVVFSPVDMIFKLDYNEVVEYHKKYKADVTLVYKSFTNTKNHFIRKFALGIDENNRINSMEYITGENDTCNLCLDSCVISKDVFIKILELAPKLSSFFDVKETIRYLLNGLKVIGYKYEGEVAIFEDLVSYLHNSLYYIRPENVAKIVSKDWPIYTKTYDTVPSLIESKAQIKNSYVSNGSKVNGTVINSVIGRNVIIQEGAYIENSVILSDTFISEGTVIKNAVIDKECKIVHSKELLGKLLKPLYVKKGEKI